MMMKKIKESLVDIVFPPVCPICGNPAPYEDGKRLRICRNCMDKLSYIKEPRCMKCGKHIEDETHEYCADCIKKDHVFRQAVATFEYASEITDSIYRFKYKNHREYADTYGYFMANACKEYINRWKIDMIIPVPLFKKKEKRRGYNQSALIAESLGSYLGLPVDDDFLLRVRETVPMKSLDDVQRTDNLMNAFVCRTGRGYGNVLLVDDIYTTGTTADECAKALRKAGVKNVYFTSLCIGDGF